MAADRSRLRAVAQHMLKTSSRWAEIEEACGETRAYHTCARYD